jgi:flavin reductase (DIM6/NTAB) family NADH-FMN oxidoreductase RutF
MTSAYLKAPVTPSAVGLVITRAGTASNVMTVSFFSEVAHYPAALWVSIHEGSYTHQLIEESGIFTLAVLHEGQRELALHCGTVSGRDKDKCAAVGLHAGPEGFLFPDDALTAVACRVRTRRKLDDHTLYIADLLVGELETKRSIRRHLLTVDLL